MLNFIKKRCINTIQYSISGLYSAFRSEQAFRLELAIAIILLPLGFFLGKNDYDKIFLISSVVLVLIVELLNTGLEKITDRVSTELHPLSKMVKDLGSAAVFLSICLCASIWLIILL
jgi:diacylglycerol kinase (ATP)